MTPIDRHADRRRPEGRNAGTQRWTDLLFVHRAIDPAAVAPLLPAPLRLDPFVDAAGRETHFIGLVPFRMQAIAPPLVPAALGLDFFEANLRLYVRHEGRPGVFFLSLEASDLLAVEVARAFWGLPYHDADLALSAAAPGDRAAPVGPAGAPCLVEGATLRYEGRRRDDRARFRVAATIGPAVDTTADPLADFLLERYVLFVRRGDELHAGRVHHRPYPAFAATLLELDESLTAARGVVPFGAPFAHASPGVDVEVFATTKVARLDGPEEGWRRSPLPG